MNPARNHATPVGPIDYLDGGDTYQTNRFVDDADTLLVEFKAAALRYFSARGLVREDVDAIIETALRASTTETWRELWKNRTTTETSVDFLKRVYRAELMVGLTRAEIRKLDKPLYLALAKVLKRGDPVPAGLEKFDMETPQERLRRESSELGLQNPQDVGQKIADPRKAQRLYAHLRRQQTGGGR